MAAADLPLIEYLSPIFAGLRLKQDLAASLVEKLAARYPAIATPVDLWLARLSEVRILCAPHLSCGA